MNNENQDAMQDTSECLDNQIKIDNMSNTSHSSKSENIIIDTLKSNDEDDSPNIIQSSEESTPNVNQNSNENSQELNEVNEKDLCPNALKSYKAMGIQFTFMKLRIIHKHIIQKVRTNTYIKPIKQIHKCPQIPSSCPLPPKLDDEEEVINIFEEEQNSDEKINDESETSKSNSENQTQNIEKENKLTFTEKKELLKASGIEKIYSMKINQSPIPPNMNIPQTKTIKPEKKEEKPKKKFKWKFFSFFHRKKKNIPSKKYKKEKLPEEVIIPPVAVRRRPLRNGRRPPTSINFD